RAGGDGGRLGPLRAEVADTLDGALVRRPEQPGDEADATLDESVELVADRFQKVGFYLGLRRHSRCLGSAGRVRRPFPRQKFSLRTAGVKGQYGPAAQSAPPVRPGA